MIISTDPWFKASRVLATEWLSSRSGVRTQVSEVPLSGACLLSWFAQFYKGWVCTWSLAEGDAPPWEGLAWGGQPCPSGLRLAVELWPDVPVGVTLCSCPFLKYTEEKVFLLGDKVQKVGLGALVLAGCQL